MTWQKTTRRTWVYGYTCGTSRINLHSAIDSIDEDIVIVSTGLPHSISEQPSVFDERAFGRERIRVVIGNHDLGRFIVDVGLTTSPSETKAVLFQVCTHRLAARVNPRVDTRGSRTFRVEEATVDQSPEVKGTSGSFVITTGIHAPGVIPCIPYRLIS